MNAGATRCHHCTAHQNWFRFLNNGTLIVGLVLALLSIMAAQPVASFLDSKKAEITVSILEGDYLHTVFMVSNTGSRPAGLQQVTINAKTKGGSGTWYLQSELDKKLLEPGNAYVLNASNGSVIPAPIPHEINAVLYGRNINPETCNLVLEFVQMNGTKVFQATPFPCYPVANNSRDPLADPRGPTHPSTGPAAKSAAGR
ncbi:MAG TPA: hypothetical protein PLE48_15375 [Thiobacillus sp.]|nr:hypothetical protein [Thiobacillus sp.]HQT71784.1 hypothetical protein [Thiobacillus sp.]